MYFVHLSEGKTNKNCIVDHKKQCLETSEMRLLVLFAMVSSSTMTLEHSEKKLQR